jgi:glutathione S-transferase
VPRDVALAPDRRGPRARVRLWGSELSPFTLKLRALCDAAGIPYRMLPEEGGRLENLRAATHIELAKRRRTVVRYPATSPLDEYPLVPFAISGGRVYYDSSALARWLDHLYPPESGPLVPGDPALAFATQLIDEAFDEFGLYMVHHARWVISATTNDAGRRLAREFVGGQQTAEGAAKIANGAVSRRPRLQAQAC